MHSGLTRSSVALHISCLEEAPVSGQALMSRQGDRVRLIDHSKHSNT
jgi:hypothetical protein